MTWHFAKIEDCHQHLLMDKHVPDGQRKVSDVDLDIVMHRLAVRSANENGISTLSALADLSKAIELAIQRELFLPQILGNFTWADVGAQLGVSAQAAHRKYREPPGGRSGVRP